MSDGEARQGEGRMWARMSRIGSAGRRRWGLGLVAGFLLAAVLAGAALLDTWLSPMDPSDPRSIITDIPQGAGAGQIGAILESAGLVKNRFLFTLAALYYDRTSRLQAGEYALNRRQSIREILDQLAAGRVVTYSITIPEGFTAAQIAQRLVDLGWAEPGTVERLLDDRSLVADFVPAGLPLRHALEGYLFPDTYIVTRSVTTRDILELMLKRFRAAWSPDLAKRAQELGLSPHQVITLASIVEKETRVPDERPIIAGVYLNRLKRGMPLGADPTIRYALDRPEGPLYNKDLDVSSPYNTYRHTGLPPGPICSPGLASIRAVLYPADVPYLYFVARPDGTHAFARTYPEHLANVRRYESPPSPPAR